MFVRNPLTKRLIKVGGPTYHQLEQAGWADYLESDPLESKDKMTKDKAISWQLPSPVMRKKLKGRAGCSNMGKYGDVDAPFCGPAGGSCPGTYPVGTYGHYRNTLSRAHNAPRPEAIQECARNWAKRQGWLHLTRQEQRQLEQADLAKKNRRK